MQIKNKLFSTALALSALIFVGCQKQDFVALNTNPDVLYSVKPEEQFFNAGRLAHSSDFEQFYDNYRRIMHWMQMSTAQGGNNAALPTASFSSNVKQVSGSRYLPTSGSGRQDILTFISFDSASVYLAKIQNFV